MGLSINTNLAALTAQRNLGVAAGQSSSALAKLSSGSRVPRAKDDAAALAIGSQLRSEVAALEQASLNAGQAVSLLQIADGALSTTNDILVRLRSLASQSSSGQLADADRSLLDTEYQSLLTEIDRVAADTAFNATTLLAGSTSVSSDVNDLVPAASSDAQNLIAAGFENIEFADNFGDGAIKITFDQANDVLTVKDLANDKEQAVSISATAISSGSTEVVNFNTLGVTITLNSDFDKTADINPADAETSVVDVSAYPTSAFTENFTETDSDGSVVVVDNLTVAFDNLDSGELVTNDDLDGVTVTFDITDSSAVTATATVGGNVFTASANDLGATGTDTFTFTDGEGNSFTLDTTITTAGLENGDTLTVDIAATRDPAVEVASIELDTVVVNGTTPFDFGSIDEGTITFDLTAASAATATFTQNGTVFNTTNGGGTIDLTSTGTKTLTLGDANGNDFVVKFNVTSVFGNDDSFSIELKELGQVVGANEISGSSNTFDFRVGTGTSASADEISVAVGSATTTDLGINGGAITTQATAETAITAVTAAINTLSTTRATIGASQSRLEFAAASIAVAIENTTSAQSALLDVDVSKEITNFTSKQVLLQAGISLLSQANQQPALLLRLLQ